MRACFPRFGRVLPVFALAFTAACGSSYQTVKVKEYRLALVQGDPVYKDEFRSLAADFNAYAQMHVLDFEDTGANANSAIIMTQGLESETDGKVGLGQWLSESTSDSPFTSPGSHPKRTVYYSMRLEFDVDYFHERLGAGAQNRYEKQKLFFHEVGHGLEMDHVQDDPTDVMYPDISGDKNFSTFFARVRAYMNAN